ncbi:hypothetical protein A9Q84_07315 [Halobacteriovorax marinus]|uniref:Antitoxin n=1 Tax=Halobacteriovorax marinus TaxID=97084 RepID=A0A1Y5FC02_9BACT|nr:hypothetical protein A9Q84_07315 [Halobacteriovorax marinus]
MSGELNNEELDLANQFSRGEFKKSDDPRDFKEIARRTKNSRINLRLQDDVLEFFQKKADREGVPYQTLINSALYKIAKGRLVEIEVADLVKEIKEIKDKISELKLGT